MSYCNLNTFLPCEDLQGNLDQFFNTCNASQLREATPFFDFLMSDPNRAGLQQTISPGNGKYKTVNLKYQKRYLESDVLTDQANPKCTNSNQPYDCNQAYTIDPTQNVSHGFYLNIADLRNVCESNREIFANQIQMSVDAVMRKLATDMTTDAVTLLGRWNTNVEDVTGGDRLDLATLKSVASGDINPVLYQKLELALMQTGYCAPPALFAGTELYSYFRNSSMSGCCSNEGIDLNAQWNNFGISVSYDKRVASTAGGNEFAWVVQPGALALITWNQFAGEGASITGIEPFYGTDYVHMVIYDPKTGFPLDLTIKDNCGTVSVNVTATAKVVGLPNDLYKVGDEQWGVKYFNKIKVVNS